MNLYFISASDQDGEDLDLLCVAESPRQAHAQWKQHWWEGEGAPLFNDPVIQGNPQLPLDEILTIWLVKMDITKLGPLIWGSDVEIVGYVTHA